MDTFDGSLEPDTEQTVDDESPLAARGPFVHGRAFERDPVAVRFRGVG